MLYASSKDAIRRRLVGIAVEVQATDPDEIAYESSECFLQLLRISIIHRSFLVVSKAERL